MDKEIKVGGGSAAASKKNYRIQSCIEAKWLIKKRDTVQRIAAPRAA